MRLPAYRHEQTGNPALDRIQANVRALYEYLKATLPGAPTPAVGDILVYDGTSYVRLPMGTAGQTLKVNAAGDGIGWE